MVGEVSFRRTLDYDLVRELLSRPEIYGRMVDDYCPAVSEFRAVEHPVIWYVLAEFLGEPIGLFAFEPENHVCWQVHICLLRRARPRGREIVRAMLAWLWANSWCMRLVARVPEGNCLALRLARDSGFTEFGRNPQSFMKGGRLTDQILLGVSRPE